MNVVANRKTFFAKKSKILNYTEKTFLFLHKAVSFVHSYNTLITQTTVELAIYKLPATWRTTRGTIITVR